MIKTLIFDFGGVILDICRQNSVIAFQQMGLTNADEFLDEYLQKGFFYDLEGGFITADEFCVQLSLHCHRDVTFDMAYECWMKFISGLPQERLELLSELRKDFKVLILSNTNPFVMKWAHSPQFSQKGLPLDDYVDKIYASYELNLLKPDAHFFEYMINDANIIPEEALFVDDGIANIKAAKSLGFNVFHVQTPQWIPQFKQLI